MGAVAALLARRHGLRFDGAGQQRLARGIRETARRAGTVPDALAHSLAADAGAEGDLLDRVTLQESSWFRDEVAWAALRDVVLPRALRQDPQLEVWSAGCAHGQEAWGLAMLLDELGATSARVVASDVSGAAVARAAAGRYGPRELQGLSPERRRRHGRAVEGGWEVAPVLRERVRFTRHSLAADAPPVTAAHCRLVLCRYVLIYLTPAAAASFLEVVRTTLGPDGVLIVGAAETLWHVTEAFVAEPVGGTFAYRPRPREPAPPATPSSPRASRRPPRPGARPAARGPSRIPGPRAGDASPPRAHEPIREREAHDPVPDAAALLHRGEEAVRRGDHADAVAAFRGAAFLAPGDPEAHLRLGLALERLGDAGASRAFRAARAALQGRRGGHAGGDPAELERILTARLGPPPGTP
jgi:chemotaxis protein methyltransferase CheR